jgi:hypothetical protein
MLRSHASLRSSIAQQRGVVTSVSRRPLAFPDDK